MTILLYYRDYSEAKGVNQTDSRSIHEKKTMYKRARLSFTRRLLVTSTAKKCELGAGGLHSTSIRVSRAERWEYSKYQATLRPLTKSSLIAITFCFRHSQDHGVSEPHCEYQARGELDDSRVWLSTSHDAQSSQWKPNHDSATPR